MAKYRKVSLGNKISTMGEDYMGVHAKTSGINRKSALKGHILHLETGSHLDNRTAFDDDHHYEGDAKGPLIDSC
jgi:hypothetical protein